MQRRATRRIIGQHVTGTPFAIEKALHVGQKRNKLAVMTFFEMTGIFGELIIKPAPGLRLLHRLKYFPVPAINILADQWFKLQRPDQIGVE